MMLARAQCADADNPYAYFSNLILTHITHLASPQPRLWSVWPAHVVCGEGLPFLPQPPTTSVPMCVHGGIVAYPDVNKNLICVT